MVCMIGMLLVPNASAETPGLQVEQPVYEKLVGQSVVTKFFGYVDYDQKRSRVILEITTPTGDIIENKMHPTSDGYFELFYSLDKYAETGIYAATATYHDDVVGITTFELVDHGNYSLSTEQSTILNEPSDIPSWVKNIFVWYGQDLVSEKELLDAIKFLVIDGIINLEN
tara:strand:+ start:3481 stop:3990 length:510 start_codon:yes stop_codon:yes gene_type:complete